MLSSQNDNRKIRCSFCGKTESQVSKLISGPAGIYICDECVGICAEIIDEDTGSTQDEHNKCSICGANKENVQIFFYDDFSDRTYCGRCVDRLSTLYAYKLRLLTNPDDSFEVDEETGATENIQLSDDEAMESDEKLSQSDDIPNDLDELLRILKG